MTGIQGRFLLQRQDFCLDVDFNLPDTGVTVVFGESGSGKTTLLRCIAGLESPSKGVFKLINDHWQSQLACLPTHKRPLGFVFQDAGLLPHLNVWQNLNYAIKRCLEKPTVDQIDEVIAVMDIRGLMQRTPDQLSGGERQRVAIARALLSQPKLLLMDEPLASLDEARKNEILPYLEKIKRQYRLPIIYITHSVEEMNRLADFVILMKKGQIEYQGEALPLFSRLDASFQSGDQASVVIEGNIMAKDALYHLDEVLVGSSIIRICQSEYQPGELVRIRILAKDVSLTLSEQNDSSILNRIPVTIAEINRKDSPSTALVRVLFGDQSLISRTTLKSIELLSLKVGDKIWAQIKSAAILR